MKRPILLSLVAATLALAAIPAQAGSQHEWTYCTRYKGGGGYCAGTFRGYRNHADPTASVHFALASNGGYGVQVNYEGRANVCMVPPGSDVEKIWPLALSHSGNFQLSWNAAGECIHLYLGNGSADRDF
jgi:hypothetical protein